MSETETKMVESVKMAFDRARNRIRRGESPSGVEQLVAMLNMIQTDITDDFRLLGVMPRLGRKPRAASVQP